MSEQQGNAQCPVCKKHFFKSQMVTVHSPSDGTARLLCKQDAIAELRAQVRELSDIYWNRVKNGDVHVPDLAEVIRGR